MQCNQLAAMKNYLDHHQFLHAGLCWIELLLFLVNQCDPDTLYLVHIYIHCMEKHKQYLCAI